MISRFKKFSPSAKTVYIAVFLFRVQKTMETLHQICTEKYDFPEKQGRCSVCTVSPRHVFLTLEITGVVWAICERFPSSFVCE